MPFLLRIVTISVLFAATTSAYKPIPRKIPPAGKPVPDESLANLTKALADFRTNAKSAVENPLFPDIEIYLKAVDLAVEFGEFYKPPSDIKKAANALTEAEKRLSDLQGGRSPWEQADGLVVRGYRSRIDGSSQPYGLEIPEKLDLSGQPVPLYVWLHGRGDSQTDLHFIDQRSKKHWQFKGLLDDGIVLHPFGRQCIGYKSAGEIDVLDAVDHVIANYNVDPDRIALMGFSMGGAGAWHLGAHYADKWAVVHAGAGFVDVKRYQRLGPDKMPSAMEQTLWGTYDVPNYARNLLNVPVIAYSGQVDKQKDAADFMEEVLKTHGHELTHVVGPKMGHKYHKKSLVEVAAFIKKALAKPKNRNPDKIHLQTRTLRYNKYAWLEILALDEHWQNSRVDATLVTPKDIKISTTNIRSLFINRPLAAGTKVNIDGATLSIVDATKGIVLNKTVGARTVWTSSLKPITGITKSPQSQGPIDDAFLAPFLVVTPTGKSKDPALDKWVDFELAHLKSRWRALFRGDLRIKPDTAVTARDGELYNLVLFGTPESNKLIADALAQIPLEWPPEPNRVLLSVYPNPRASKRYIVLNSGPTFREGHDRTNSLQNPKLGDWAIIDLSEPPGPERPGKIIKTGFFDENWKLSK